MELFLIGQLGLALIESVVNSSVGGRAVGVIICRFNHVSSGKPGTQTVFFSKVDFSNASSISMPIIMLMNTKMGCMMGFLNRSSLLEQGGMTLVCLLVFQPLRENHRITVQSLKAYQQAPAEYRRCCCQYLLSRN